MKIKLFNKLKSDNEIINNSGLFFFKTQLDDNIKLEIANWYNNLSENEKKFIDIIINEASDEIDYFI